MKLQLPEQRDSAVDGILAHFFDGKELSAKHDEILKRVEFVYDYTVDGMYTHSQIVKIAARKFDVSASCAEKDLMRAKLIYRRLRAIHIDAQYVVELQIAERVLAMALKKGDVKAAATAHKNKLEILARLKEMENTVDASKFVQHVNVLMVQLGEGGDALKIDLNNVEKMPMHQRVEYLSALKQHKDAIAEAEIVGE